MQMQELLFSDLKFSDKFKFKTVHSASLEVCWASCASVGEMWVNSGP